jgi:ABC-type uncharacterized transport system permease subunit
LLPCFPKNVRGATPREVSALYRGGQEVMYTTRVMDKLLIGLAAIAAQVPAALLPFRRTTERADMAFWVLLLVALLGPAAYVGSQLAGQWHSGLSATLWVSVTASAGLFLLLCVITREAWRLTPLLLPYLALLSLIAVIWAHAPAHMRPPMAMNVDGWLLAHIVLSVLTYAFATVAAVAGAAVFLQERALKRKRPTRLTAVLPAVADAEFLQVRLLAAAGLVLGIDILSGMVVEYFATGTPIHFEHKPLLSILAFAVILGLLVLHHRTGMRGRSVARLVLVAYLLLTLGYPGVKFVTDVLLA